MTRPADGARDGDAGGGDPRDDDAGGGEARPRPDVIAAVLAGGGSRRMGQDKAALVLDGRRLLDRAVGALRAATPGGRPVLVVGPHQTVVGASPEPVPTSPAAMKESPEAPAEAPGEVARRSIAADLPHGARWISDLRPAAGPLAGLEAALAAAEGAEVLLVTGVDHPWQAPSVLRRLVDRLVGAEPGPAAVVLGTADGPQLLVGAYRPAALATVRGLLDAGERRLRSLRDHLDVEVLPPEGWRDLDPLGATAVDVDDPDALAAATQWDHRAVATATGGPTGRARTAGEVPDPAARPDRGNQAATRPDRGNQAATQADRGNQAAARPDRGNQAAARPDRGNQAATPGRAHAPVTPAREDRGTTTATQDRLGTTQRWVLRVHSRDDPTRDDPTRTDRRRTRDVVDGPARGLADDPAASQHDSIEVESLAGVLVREEPLEIRAAGPDQEPVTLATTLRTPGHEPELAVGWVLAEGLASPMDVVGTESGDPQLVARPEDTITVRLQRAVDQNTLVHRHVIATASCGVCGRATIEELATRVAPITDDPFRTDPLTWSRFARLPEELRLAQGRFRATGGLHAAGLFDPDGRLVTVREDVGRHNALDAAIGAHALSGLWPPAGLTDLVCVLSGRVGFELVAKAAAARIPVVAAVGAASELAARTAQQLGVTLVGLLRDGDGVVYSHPDRLLLPDPQ
ncbi:MAG: formate dehydrogenase accessory sulfurtransferase FdhD [Nitriliruptoraceae bacterium]